MDEDEILHYWSLYPDCSRDEIMNLLQINVDASYEYHLYHTFNNEAS